MIVLLFSRVLVWICPSLLVPLQSAVSSWGQLTEQTAKVFLFDIYVHEYVCKLQSAVAARRSGFQKKKSESWRHGYSASLAHPLAISSKRAILSVDMAIFALSTTCKLLQKWTNHHYHHHHQFILETQNMTMSENTEQNNKTCVPRVRKAAKALTTAHITKSSTV